MHLDSSAVETCMPAVAVFSFIAGYIPWKLPDSPLTFAAAILAADLCYYWKHHGSNPEYLDKNYGGILIVWDKLFGSFRAEAFPPRYGTAQRNL